MNIMGSTSHMHPPDVARVWWRNYNPWHWLYRINMPRRLPVEPIWGTQSWWLQWLTSRNRTTCQLIESLFPQVQLSRDGDSKSGKNINSSLLITRSCAPVNTLMFCFILGYVNHGCFFLFRSLRFSGGAGVLMNGWGSCLLFGSSGGWSDSIIASKSLCLKSLGSC